MELLTLTVREEAATRFLDNDEALVMLARASADFPDYSLGIEEREGCSVVLTIGMPVQRWLRV